MSSEIGSMRPNPYLFDIENRKKRRPRLAHDLGAGAKCNKCGDKCSGFELHFWRKICMNCRCGKDDHDVQDDEEDIGKIVIGKLFDRPARTEREELEYCHGNNLEMVNEETGKPENVKFDWVPPNVEKTLASRYMELLPPEKRPVAGSEAAKARRRQLETQIPLYDMDAAQRSDSLPPEELQNFMAYLERIRTQVAGQGSVQEIVGAPSPAFSRPLQWQSTPGSVGTGPGVGDLDANGNIGYYPDAHPEIGTMGLGPLDQASIQNNNLGVDGTTQTADSSAISPSQLRRGSSQTPSLRQQFLGGLLGEPAGLPGFKVEDPAFSTPYGGSRMSAKPLHDSRNDRGVDAIETGLSDLNVENRMMGDAPGQKSVVPGLPPLHPGSFGHPEPNKNNNTYSPYSGASKGYRPVRPDHLREQGTQVNIAGGDEAGQPSILPGMPGNETGHPSNTSYQPELRREQVASPFGVPGSLPGQPGYQSVPLSDNGNQSWHPSAIGNLSGQPQHSNLQQQSDYSPRKPGQSDYQSRQPGQPNYESGQPEYQPGQPEHQPGQPGHQSVYQKGQPGYQPEPGYQPGHPGYSPGKPTYQPGQPGYSPGKPTYQPGQPGYQLGMPGYLDSQEGSQLGNIGHQPNQPNSQLDKIGLHSDQSSDLEFPPPPPELLAFSSNQSGNDAGSIDSGVELYDNVSAKLRSKINENEGRAPLLQMLAKERSIASVEAMQAPYGAQIDTMTGNVSIAPGSDVSILFPGESQLIGSPAKKNAGARDHKSKYTCQGCNLPMNVGDVAIFCERAGEDKCWHPACFSCFTCKELLADLIYFYKDGKVFCGRHFTESEEMPRCKACDELIFGNSWTRADGFDWHINHFCCNVCDTEMAGQRYVPDQNGYPYCLPCYMSYVAKMCEGCEDKISPEVNRCGHRGYFYHATPQCFKCYTCKDTLLGKRFKMSKNWVFCSNECIQEAAEDLAINTNPKTKEEV